MESLNHITSWDSRGSDISGNTLHESKILSDITINYSGREKPAHKLILAKKSKFFYKAFTGGFPIAESNTVDLGNDEDVEVIEAMFRHIYDMPYKADVNHPNPINFDFEIDVYMAADKYDVPTLRAEIVKEVGALMVDNSKTPEFALAIQRLCGSASQDFADKSLQNDVVAFCAKDFHTLYSSNTTFASMTDAGELLDNRFAGCLLKILATKSNASPSETLGSATSSTAVQQSQGRPKSSFPFIPPEARATIRQSAARDAKFGVS